MKKFLAIVLALTLCVALLAGCSKTDKGGDSGKTVVNVAVTEDLGSCSPWISNNGGRINILGSIYQHLIETDGFGGPMVGVIMESYEAVEPNVYDMKIYEDIYDTAGNHLTASDVAFSYNTDIAMGFHAGRYGAIVSVEAVDDYTVRWTFTEAPYDGDLTSVWSEAYIVTQAAYEASDDEMATDPVGTSPYKMTEYVPGTSLTIERTGNYWQKDTSKTMDLYEENVDVINFITITDISQIATGLKTGTIDMTNTIDGLDLPDFQEGGAYADKFSCVQVQANPCYMLEYNCNEASPCSNVNLRKAIAHCIDSDALVASVLSGAGYRFNSTGNPKYGDSVADWGKDGYFEYDLEIAKDYLKKYQDETGVDPSTLNLRFQYRENGYPTIDPMCEAIQGYILALGLNCSLEKWSASNYTENLNDPTKWDLGLICNSGASNNFLIVWYVNVMLPYTYDHGDNSNQSFICDQKLFDLIEGARTIEDHTAENMTKIEDYIVENCYYVGLCGYYEYFVTTPWITYVAHENRNLILPGGCQYDWSLKK